MWVTDPSGPGFTATLGNDTVQLNNHVAYAITVRIRPPIRAGFLQLDTPGLVLTYHGNTDGYAPYVIQFGKQGRTRARFSSFEAMNRQCCSVVVACACFLFRSGLL